MATRIVNVSRHSSKIWVEVKDIPGRVGQWFGFKTKTRLFWTKDNIYWYDSMGNEVPYGHNPDDYQLKEWVREHDARVVLFGETLA